MILGFPRQFVLLIAAPAVLLVGCAVPASAPVTITKVNPYHLQTARIVKTEDRMIEFEHRRHLYGAVENSEKRELMGNYFTVFWETKTKDPVTVRFDYLQGNTGLEMRTKEVQVNSPKRSNVTKFQVIGDEYWNDGKVTQWKVSIIENGALVAEYKSFLWK